VNEEKYALHVIGVSNQRATHIRLVRGVVKRNPHVRVLCPTLAKGEVCNRTGKSLLKGDTKEILRPKLLVKNHGDTSLQLWMCEGCKDKFLLRVNLQ